MQMKAQKIFRGSLRNEKNHLNSVDEKVFL